MFNIVWIDEDINILEDLIEPLRDAKGRYSIVEIPGFAIARNRLEEVPAADLILLDILGPSGGGNRPEQRRPGLVFLKELRETHGWKKAVVCLSVKGRDVADELGKYGVTEVLSKPVRPSEVKIAVDKALSAQTHHCDASFVIA
jgi:DNA-binding NarL/FixJ family response regulator